MTSWLERRAWRKQFKEHGDLYVQRMVMASNYSGDKLACARRWLDHQHQHHFYTPIALLIAALAALVGIFSAIAALTE